MDQFKFSDEILATCTTQEESLFHINPKLSWREDLTQKQKRQIVNAVKTFAKDYVFFQRHISNVNMNCDAFYKLKSLSWSKDYPDKGESPKASNGRHFKELVDTQYDSISQAITAVDSTHIFARPDWTATEYRFSILRLEAVVLVGKRNEPVYGEDVEAWKRGEKTLWNAHYKVGIRCEQSTTLPDAELTSELDDMAIEHSF